MVSERTLILKIGDEQYGLPLTAVVEVFEAFTPLTPVPGAPDWMGGIINHHGQVIPVIRMSSLLGVDSEQNSNQVVLVEVAGERFGLAVDRIESLEVVRAEGPQVQGCRRSWHRGALVALMDPSQLVENIQRRLTKRGAERTRISQCNSSDFPDRPRGQGGTRI